MNDAEYQSIEQLQRSLSAPRATGSRRERARETAKKRPSRALILAAFAAVYLIWGSTYLAIKSDFVIFALIQDFYIPFCSMHANSLPVFYHFGGIFHSDNCR